jgi:hypothetical protein
MAKTLSEQWTTTMSVTDLAKWFRSTAEERHAGTGRFARAVARGKGVEFFTPDRGDDPFAAVDEQPAFTAGVTMPRGGGFQGQAELVTLHIYVYDRGDRRAVEFAAPVATAGDQFRSGRVGGVGHTSGGAKKFLRHFAETLQQRDPGARKEG